MFAILYKDDGRFLSPSGNPVCEELDRPEVNTMATFDTVESAENFIAELDFEDAFPIRDKVEIIMI